MNRLPIEVHPDAVEEARQSRRWYADRSPGAAEAFMDELDRAIDRISEAPDRWAVYLHGTRRYLLHRFPFAVVYRHDDRRVQIVAVAHAKRKPGYWRSRLD